MAGKHLAVVGMFILGARELFDVGKKTPRTQRGKVGGGPKEIQERNLSL